MTDITNEDRIDWAESALFAFSCEYGNGELGSDTLTDLLANLMHWSDKQGVDFDDSIRLARMHFEAEKV